MLKKKQVGSHQRQFVSFSVSSEMYFTDEMLSDGDNSCNSSHLSNKSEKNMADFEGEDVMSDDEISRINAQTSHFGRHRHMQQHLANMASVYKDGSK